MTDELRFAIRLWQRDRGFTVTAVLVLAIGIGVSTMLFTILEAHTIRGLPLDRPERVLSISSRDERNVDRGWSWVEFDELRRASTAMSLVAFTSGPAGLSLPDAAPDRIERAFVSGETFSVLGIEPIVGRALLGDDDEAGAPRVVVATETVTRRLFGSAPAALGKTVMVDGEPAVLVGVVRDSSGFPGTAALWQPLNTSTGLDRVSRTAACSAWSAASRTVRTRTSLPPRRGRSRTVSRGASRLERRDPRLRPAHQRTVAGPPRRSSVAGVHRGGCSRAPDRRRQRGAPDDRPRSRARPRGGNQSVARRRQRAHCPAASVIETAVVAAAGGLAGLVLAVAGVRAFALGIPAGTLPYWMAYTNDVRVLAALVAASCLAALIAGVAPAWQAARTDPNATLRSLAPPFAVSRTSRRLTGAFLVAELALGVVMIANVVLAVRTARIEIGTDAALRDSTVITARFSLPARSYPDAAARNAFYDRLVAAVAAAPGTTTFALTSVLPARPAPERRVIARGRESEPPLAVRQVAGDASYFEALRIPLVSGRPFSPADNRAPTRSVLLNDRLARLLFPGGDALGQRVAILPAGAAAAPDWLEVIGIAPAIRQGGQPDVEPTIYVPFRVDLPAAAALLVRTSGGSAVAELRERVRRLDPSLPLFDVATLADAVSDAQWNGRLSTRLLVALTVIAVGLATAGLFAVMNRRVVARRREIGIRLALGATPRRVRRLVVGEAFRYVAVGGVLGVAGAIAWDAVFAPTVRVAEVIRGVRLADPAALAAIGAVLGLVSLLACLAPLGRAQAVDAMSVLRDE